MQAGLENAAEQAACHGIITAASGSRTYIPADDPQAILLLDPICATLPSALHTPS